MGDYGLSQKLYFLYENYVLHGEDMQEDVIDDFINLITSLYDGNRFEFKSRLYKMASERVSLGKEMCNKSFSDGDRRDGALAFQGYVQMLLCTRNSNTEKVNMYTDFISNLTRYICDCTITCGDKSCAFDACINLDLDGLNVGILNCFHHVNRVVAAINKALMSEHVMRHEMSLSNMERSARQYIVSYEEHIPENCAFEKITLKNYIYPVLDKCKSKIENLRNGEDMKFVDFVECIIGENI